MSGARLGPGISLLRCNYLLTSAFDNPEGPSQKTRVGKKDKPLWPWFLEASLALSRDSPLSCRGLPLPPLGPISACSLITLMITTAVQAAASAPAGGAPGGSTEGDSGSAVRVG